VIMIDKGGVLREQFFFNFFLIFFNLMIMMLTFNFYIKRNEEQGRMINFLE